ncbi:MAG TPA: HAMP domain-containing sensor histidine kinase [Candidatus Acidoferrales bacterium]|nr:HAMP domain-containing sensor histidine kinase [Candidatus Acidoferrales bacterium]
MSISLRWQIAAAYALLLVAALGAASAAIVWRFQAILYDEARSRVDATMSEIASAAQPINPFPFGNVVDESFLQIFNSNNLAAWQSPTTYIQVDTTKGYPIARSPNLGALSIPPATALDTKHARDFRTVTVDGRPFLVEDRLLRSGTFSVIVHVAESLDELNRTFAQTSRTIVLILVVGAVLVVAFSFLLASQAIGPIARLSKAMHEIGSERLDLRLPGAQRRDEIGELTRSFNDLLARLQEAFARERQFISDASHELKTPLTSINANAQLLLRWGDSDPSVRRESLETIQHESAALADMVNGMLMLAKADRGDAIPKEPVSLSLVAQEAVRTAAPRAAEKGLTLDLDAPSPSPLVEGDAHLLRQLVSNLVDNAIKFTSEGGVTVRVGEDERHATIEVADTGPGIPEEELANVFERFYRTDKARSRDVPGTGLGLAIVRSIARVHGGDIEARSAPSGGALFVARFPKIAQSLTSSS